MASPMPRFPPVTRTTRDSAVPVMVITYPLLARTLEITRSISLFSIGRERLKANRVRI